LIIYECSILVFDRLFCKEDNKSIRELLFLLATCHAYTKLCLHTDTTLRMFVMVSVALCQMLRHFTTMICPWYATRELLHEVNACVTRQQAQVKNGTRERKKISRSIKLKQFNMATYKMHCIPNYLDAI
jgi:hypothetical protein